MINQQPNSLLKMDTGNRLKREEEDRVRISTYEREAMGGCAQRKCGDAQ